MNMYANTLSAALTLLGATALAQPFSIDLAVIAGGGNTGAGEGFALSGTVAQSSITRMSDGRYLMEGGFWSVLEPKVPAGESMTIFDNSDGSFAGQGFASGPVWQASRFCLGSQPFTLDSLALFLGSRDLGNPPSVRLLIYSDAAVADQPFADTGLVMNLAGESNPITFTALAGTTERAVTWTPAAAFVLAPNTCYWAVLVVDSGEVLLKSTGTTPTGAAAAFGSASSSNAGVTWGSADPTSNRKMRIRGIPSTAGEEFRISFGSFAGSGLGIRFSGIPGQRYVIESRGDLATGEWADVPGTPHTGDGTVQQVTIARAFQERQQFYRVKLLP